LKKTDSERRSSASARHAVEDYLRRPQLSRACTGTGHEIPAEPLLFFKPPSSLLRPGGAVVLPAVSERVDFEGELALVIGRRTRNLKPEDDWRDVVRGFTLANDVSARDLQKKDVQWTRAKGFDTFCPVGPMVSDELDLEPASPSNARQRRAAPARLHARLHLFAAGSAPLHFAAFTLEPGDLILTGTPSGVGPLKPGDRVEVSIPGLGVLANTVEADLAIEQMQPAAFSAS
jgi:2-keto-4-pentenoate hydratase/2-oxohepta-3-ene-1,7-dioic acid hydratase in catechol pathway